MRSVLAVVTFKSLLWQVSYAHETALLTDMDTIVVTDIKEALLQETCSTMRDHAIAFHLTKSQSSVPGPTLSWLSGEYLSGTTASGMNLVLNHVLEPLIVSRPEEDHDFQLLSTEAIVHNLISSKLIALLVEGSRDFLNCSLCSLAHSLKWSGITFNSS